MSGPHGKPPPGTRNARTGFPVGQSSAGSKKSGGCAVALLGWAGVALTVARVRGWTA